MKTNQKASRGFTLIELMIVVAILAILAAVAIVAYGQYVRKARNSEATSVLADIKIKQEAYRATFHQYANVTTASEKWIPDTNPGSEPRVWPTTGGLDTIEGKWRQLGVSADRDVYFAYACEAGEPDGDDPTTVNVDGITETGDFWYAARALQDLQDKGAGHCEGFEIYSSKGKIVTLEVGFDGWTGTCP